MYIPTLQLTHRYFYSRVDIRTTKRGGRVKPPEPLKKKHFFSMIFIKCTEPLETQEKIRKKNICLLCPVLVKIDQPKNVMKKFESLNLTSTKFCILYPF